MSRRRSLTVLVVILLVVVGIVVAVVIVGGQSDPLIAAEGEMTCAECHLERDLLNADLEADPIPEVIEAESEGEG